MALRLISLPIGIRKEQDTDGFVTETVEYVENVRAESRPATAKEETLAAAAGYTVSRVYRTAAVNYAGQNYLVDKHDGKRYEIRHASERGRMISLYAEVRRHGSIRDAARDG